jgi:hypothetical protein
MNVFAGVLAVDFTFTDISNFLIDNYQGTDTTVVIFEREEPHYFVAASTGSTGVRKVLISDGVTPCAADASSDECTAVRATAGDMDEVDADAIIRASFANQKAAGFPSDELVSSAPKGFGSIYASQVMSFTTSTGSQQGVTELNWYIMIMMPVETEDSDTILKGDLLFGILITVATVGAVVCFILIGLLVKKRKKREVIAADWRFLSAFLASCALLNLSTLSFLGPNTNETCLVRMWLVHFFLALSLSLLFTKTYRIYKLVDSATNFQSTVITHRQATKMAAPLVLIQILILLVFTFVDPSNLTELIYFSGSDITHRLICSHETPAFFITTLTYEGGLLLLGCVLAYKTRNLQSEFNESKQVIFSMYDTAVIGTIILIVSNLAIQYQGQQRLLYSLGIFWTTCFAGCVFVLPRTLKFSSRLSGRRRTASDGGRASGAPSQTLASEFSVAAIRQRSTMKLAQASDMNRKLSGESGFSSVDGQDSPRGLSSVVEDSAPLGTHKVPVNSENGVSKAKAKKGVTFKNSILVEIPAEDLEREGADNGKTTKELDEPNKDIEEGETTRMPLDNDAIGDCGSNAKEHEDEEVCLVQPMDEVAATVNDNKVDESSHEHNEVKEELELNLEEAEMPEETLIQDQKGDIVFQEEKKHDLESVASSVDSGFKEFLQFIGR